MNRDGCHCMKPLSVAGVFNQLLEFVLKCHTLTLDPDTKVVEKTSSTLGPRTEAVEKASLTQNVDVKIVEEACRVLINCTHKNQAVSTSLKYCKEYTIVTPARGMYRFS